MAPTINAHLDTILEDGRETDIVIPVMGATGAGKTTFINYLLGREQLEVGSGLTSCTRQLFPVLLDHASATTYRIVIVDTPGFDDTYVGDVEILKRIARWLEKSYRRKMTVGGAVYLHDISQDRVSGNVRRNLQVFSRLCGRDSLNNVILVTTKWDRLSHSNANMREQELKSEHWKFMIQHESQVHRFLGNTQSAQETMDILLERQMGPKRRQERRSSLLIQEELVDYHKYIPETQAGRELRYSLKEALDIIAFEVNATKDAGPGAREKFRQRKEEVKNLRKEIKSITVSSPRRFGRFFGMLAGTTMAT